MPATRETGSDANAFGRKASRRIAQHLNASNTHTNSNECTINGVSVVIKCARLGTGSVGMSYAMANRVQAVFGAFETGNGTYNIYRLDVAQATQHMRHRKGKEIGIVGKAVFINLGQLVQTVPSSAV